MVDLDQAIMPGKEPVDGRLGAAYVVIDGRRLLLFQLIDFEGRDEVENIGIPRLGTTSLGHRSGTVKGKWSAKLYYNTDVFRKMVMEYRKTGRMTYFEIVTTNSDPNTEAGRHTTIYKDCLIDGAVMSKLDINSPTMEEEVSGSYDDIEMPELFNELGGMQV